MSRSQNKAARTVAIRSIGCRTNEEEMAALEYALDRAGFSVSAVISKADIVIVNSCSVTSHTEAKVRQLLASIGRTAPDARILVTGCMAEQQGDGLLRVPHVSWVVGNGLKHEIASILTKGKCGAFFSAITRATVLPLERADPSPYRHRRTRFSVKIQEGCDNGCAYCIVPRLRGPSRCAPENGIVSVCTRAIEAGFKEIVLTGTHIGQYRSSGNRRLVNLLERLIGLPGDFRLRLSSLDPRERSDELLHLMGNSPKVCDHLHVSLQHLSEKVLAAMGRPCRDLDALLERLAAFRARSPHAGLGADFIVGFPGETGEDFEELLHRIKPVGFSYAHIFRFSPRPGTKAAAMSGAVPESVKTKRSARLRALIEQQRQEFIRGQQGSAQRIIVEKEWPVRGVTANYLAVEIPSISALHNTWLDVIIDGLGSGRWCMARPMSERNE
jgi:threonylcarbamoyladenosine tRNA methylthiotransferase MtaB